MGSGRNNALAAGELSADQRQQVEAVLEILLQSSRFRSARRGSRFLRYIVEQALGGNVEALKERMIGVEVFDRSPEYSTGEDAVVRVQAGDVRKRLEGFFAEPEAGPLPVEVLLPVGTYCPEFIFREPEADEQFIEVPAEPPVPGAEVASCVPGGTSANLSTDDQKPYRLSRPIRKLTFILLAAGIVLGLTALGWWLMRPHAAIAFQKFWAPATRARQPVLLCVAKAVAYHPSRQFLDAHGATHSGEFATEWQRMGKPFSVPPETPMRWGDLERMPEFGVATGDVYAAVQLSLAFAQMKKESQLRVGGGYPFEDLRTSPSVLVGAFNNRWTMLISAPMPYRYFEENNTIGIEEAQRTTRRWTMSGLGGGRWEDYAIVARLLTAETGQFVVILGGIGASGTQAATEFVTNPAELAPALAKLGREWPNRNLEFVISTKVTDGVSGPPSVVASAVW